MSRFSVANILAQQFAADCDEDATTAADGREDSPPPPHCSTSPFSNKSDAAMQQNPTEFEVDKESFQTAVTDPQVEVEMEEQEETALAQSQQHVGQSLFTHWAQQCIRTLFAGEEQQLQQEDVATKATDSESTVLTNPLFLHPPLGLAPGTGFPLFQHMQKTKRVRTAFSPGQLAQLERAFRRSQYLVGGERKQLAKQLALSETQVKVWFQNRRTKSKRVDCGQVPAVTDDELFNAAVPSPTAIAPEKAQKPRRRH